VPLQTDHLKINKYYGLDDPSFKLVFPEISRMLQDPGNTIKRRRNPQAIPTDDTATPLELLQCLRAMLLTDPRIDLDRIQKQKEKRVGNTCEWLLRREEFSTWSAESDPRLLRLVGSPGIGKTMISIFLVSELRSKVERSPKTTFAYFFCDNKDKDRNTPTAILRSVIRQLLLQRHALFKHTQLDFKEQGPSLFDSFYALWRILENMLRDHHAGEVSF
jgi:SpoVK/Ycf46/Vps4 family AAA+-type ATPase